MKAVLMVMRRFDKDGSGFINASELQSLCEATSTQGRIQEADTLAKDGKIDSKEFFVWYTGCSSAEAADTFTLHSSIFSSFAQKPFHQYSGDEVKAVLKIMKDFDKDNSGYINARELKSLCEVLGVQAKIQEVDTLVKDRKIDPKEFFVWYTGCSPDEAAVAFVQNESTFLSLAKKRFHEYTEDDVKSVLNVMKRFDKDGSGKIDASELQSLCEVMGIQAKIQEVDKMVKDRRIDPKEFFKWYTQCTPEQAAATFTQHGSMFVRTELHIG